MVLVAEDCGEVLGLAAFGWFRDVVKRPGYRLTFANTIRRKGMIGRPSSFTEVRKINDKATRSVSADEH